MKNKKHLNQFSIFLLVGLFVLTACSDDLTSNIRIITLSGTINITYEGKAVPYVEIGVDSSGQWISYTSLTSPVPNASWSINLSAFSYPNNISFKVVGFDHENGGRLFSKFIEPTPPVTVYRDDITGITLNLGNVINAPENVIPLTADSWAYGEITINEGIEWYSITTTSSTRYYIWWNDKESGDDTKTLDIDVYAYKSNRDLITLDVQEYDSAWDAPISFSTNTNNIYGSSTVYIRVRAFNLSYSTGNYAIVYSTSNNKPSGSDNIPGTDANPFPLTSGTWIDANLPSSTSGRTIWYSFDVTAGTTYYIWWNDKEKGNNSKTLDIKVDSYFSGAPIFVEADAAWDTPISFTAKSDSTQSTGPQKIKVSPFFKGNTGSFAIVYSTSSTRP